MNCPAQRLTEPTGAENSAHDRVRAAGHLRLMRAFSVVVFVVLALATISYYDISNRV